MSLVAAGLTAAAGTGLVSGVITRALTRIVVVLRHQAERVGLTMIEIWAVPRAAGDDHNVL